MAFTSRFISTRTAPFGLLFLFSLVVIWSLLPSGQIPYGYLPLTEKTLPQSTEKAIVAATRADTSTEWLAGLQDQWTAYAYNVDNTDPEAKLLIPKNKGHEAMVYLTFIIDRWDDLPQYTIFIHGHEKSWHQHKDLIPLVHNLRLNVLDQVGYVPLRCDWYPSCPAEIRPIAHDTVVWGPGVHRQDAEDGIVEVWDTFFPGVPLPETIAAPCCAQFAVTRARIRSRSKETYITMRDWILKTELIDDISGRVLEKLWAYIFTQEAVHCPPPPECACNYFGMCEAQNWPIPPAGVPMWTTSPASSASASTN